MTFKRLAANAAVLLALSVGCVGCSGSSSGGYFPLGADTSQIAGTYTVVSGSSTDSEGFTVTLAGGAGDTVTVGSAGEVSFSFNGATDNDPSTVDPLSESGSGTLTGGADLGPFTGTLTATGMDSGGNSETVTINVTGASFDPAAATLTVTYTGSGTDSGGNSFTFTGSFTAN